MPAKTLFLRTRPHSWSEAPSGHLFGGTQLCTPKSNTEVKQSAIPGAGQEMGTLGQEESGEPGGQCRNRTGTAVRLTAQELGGEQRNSPDFHPEEDAPPTTHAALCPERLPGCRGPGQQACSLPSMLRLVPFGEWLPCAPNSSKIQASKTESRLCLSWQPALNSDFSSE